jgi:WD40 repeat protein
MMTLVLAAMLQPADADILKWQETHVARCGSMPSWSQDGKWLFGAAEKTKKGLINVWDAGSKSRTREFKGKIDTLGGFVATDAAAGRLFALFISKDNVPNVDVMEDRKGELQRTISFADKLAKATQMCVSPDGVSVALSDGDGKIAIADADDATIRYVIDGVLLGEGTYRCMAFDETSKRLAIGWGPAKVLVWSLKEKRLDRTITLNGAACGIAWRPDGAAMAVGTEKGEVEVWDLGAGTRTSTLTGHTAPVRGVAYSPGTMWLVTADAAGGLFVWTAKNLDKLRSENVAGESFTAVRFAPEGKYFVAIGKENRVWGKKV